MGLLSLLCFLDLIGPVRPATGKILDELDTNTLSGPVHASKLSERLQKYLQIAH